MQENTDYLTVEGISEVGKTGGPVQVPEGVVTERMDMDVKVLHIEILLNF